MSNIALKVPLGFLAFYYLVLTVCRTRLLAAAFLAVSGCSVLYYGAARAVLGILSLSVIAAAFVPGDGLRILAAASPDATPDPRPDSRSLISLCLRQGHRLMVAGVLAMLAFWHSVEVGLYALFTGGVFLSIAGISRSGVRPWRRPLPLACYLAGAVAAFLAGTDAIERVVFACFGAAATGVFASALRDLRGF